MWFPWQKVVESAEIIEFGNHGNKQNGIKVVFDTDKEGGNKNMGVLKIIYDNCGFHGNKSIQSA